MIRQYPLPLPHRDAMSADDFMVTDSNREAWRWIVEQTPGAWANHCLILHGSEGSGKTHLLRIWQQRFDACVIEPGADVLATIANDAAAFPAMAIDDASRVAGNTALEIWLQHFFNVTRDAGIPLLLTARLPPKDWGLRLADIKSRLCGTMSAGLSEPDDALLTSLLMKQFEDRQLRVEYDVMDYLLRHIDRSAGAVAQLVDQVDRQALEQKRKVTVPMVREILGNRSA